MKPLNRQEFSIALKKGLGRARQHVMQYGIEEFYDLILEACLHDQNYDSQCNESRAPWLYSMIRDTPYYEKIRAAIFDNLDESDSHDFTQSFMFFRVMALNGDDQARQKSLEILFSHANQGSSEDNFMTAISLDSLSHDKFLTLARIYGNRLIKDPTDNPPDCPVYSNKFQTFRDLLLTYSEQDERIKRYYQYLMEEDQKWLESRSVSDKSQRENRRNSYRQEYPFIRALFDINNKIFKNRFRISTFGRYATKKELQTIYKAMINEKDPAVQMLYLYVFRRTPLPELNPILFEWARGSDKNLRDAAIEALSLLQNEEIHSFAQSLIQETFVHDPFTSAICLFHRNYEKSDASLIVSAVTSMEADEYETHSIGMDLLTLSENQSDPNLADALLWLYEVTPCSHCRSKTVQTLIKYHRITDEISREIVDDADPYICELGNGLLNMQLN